MSTRSYTFYGTTAFRDPSYIRNMYVIYKGCRICVGFTHAQGRIEREADSLRTVKEPIHTQTRVISVAGRDVKS